METVFVLIFVVIVIAVCYLLGVAWYAIVKWLWRNIRK
jgi:hypothetical protein